MNRRADNIVADLRKYLEQAQESGVHSMYVDAQRIAASRDTAPAAPTTPATSATPESAPKGRGASIDPEPESVLAQPRVRVAAGTRSADEKARALAELDAKKVSVCTKCSLHETRNNTVFGVGSPNAGLVVVGEAPGRDEDMKGEPFVGMAGQLLTKILGAIGFGRDDVYICNVLKCRPPENRDPRPEEVVECEPYLLQQLDIIQPKIICALGRHAAHTLLKSKESLGKMRGRVHDYHGIPTMVTYHPAALLRNPNWKRPTWEDVQQLRSLYDELMEKES